ncbi:hypothetical protein PIN31115_04469 [Pandoraea iniqua]|uniref:N-acetyltransferase domain-containing protein n=2 Tax=Pandoraea iniqua TaxID=2508288 RepID=A0A5E4YGH2_9BURK|nr:hypothetical protein PIN31115_04469 [Pandoraea iniqua]
MDIRRQFLLSTAHQDPRATAHRSRFRIRLLGEDHIKPILSLRQRVIGSLSYSQPMPNESAAGEESFVRRHCGAEGEALGVFDGHDLVACAMLGLPSQDDVRQFSPGDDVTAPESTCYLGACIIRPDYNGHGLQRALISSRLALAHMLGRDQCLTSISVHNHHGRQDMLAEGLQIVGVTHSGDEPRQILKSCWKAPETSCWDEIVQVDAVDYDTQKCLTQAGFRGFAQSSEGAHTRITFGRPA